MATDYSFSQVCESGGLGEQMTGLLGSDDIVPGAQPSYETCKQLFLYHPLGAKMTEGPIKLAQSQEREITIQNAPDEVKQAFVDKWGNLGGDISADEYILNVHTQARVYGIASIILGIEDYPSDKPADLQNLYKQSVFFNVLDPLNTAGSLVLSQIPTSPNFQKPQYIRSYGQAFHPSRAQVVMNEQPIFISYTSSAFGFVGRSVYQRALYPLKAFLISMVADLKIQQKLAVLVAKMKSPSSVVTKGMQAIAGVKRWLLKIATNGNVIGIDPDEDISAIDMTNVDGAGTYSRNNIVRNIESAADMPAKMLDQETMASGLSDGTEDAKRNAHYVERIRIKMRPTYAWFTNIVQYLAWNPVWYQSVIQTKYPEYADVEWSTAFMEWRKNFHAQWPSLLIEPESEAIKAEQVKLEAVVAILNTLLQTLDPFNKTRLIEWAADCFGENKRLFPVELVFDWEALNQFQEENQKRQNEARQEPVEKGAFPHFGDAAAVEQNLERLRSVMNDYSALVAQNRKSISRKAA